MFEQFDESARQVVAYALEEARRERHAVIGGDHLLIGVARAEPPLVDASLRSLREALRAGRGRGDSDPVTQLPFTAEASKALKRASSAARAAKKESVMPAHVLLALLAVDPLVASMLSAVGLDSEKLREKARKAAARHQPRRDYEQALRDGDPVPVTIGAGPPIGDLGHPRTDVRMLLAVLAAGSSVASALVEHGLGADEVRALAQHE